MIDAHHHLWDLQVREQPWLDEFPILQRSFAIGELSAQLQSNKVDGSIVVQTVPDQGETEELLALASADNPIVGVVGWTDLTTGRVREQVEYLSSLAGGDKLVGIRHGVQSGSGDWFSDSAVIDGVAALGQCGLVFELLVRLPQLNAAIDLVRQLPQTRFVLDHAGKPGIARGSLDPWRSQILELSEFDNVACKLSGLTVEAGERWQPQDLKPYVDHVVTSFGPRRVMIGSDWPVCLLAGSYTDTWAAFTQALVKLDPVAQAEILGGTAKRWYDLAHQTSSTQEFVTC